MLFDLRLLLLDGVDENHSHAVVLNAFHFTFCVVSNKEWLNLLNIFRAETYIFHATLFPIKSNWRKTTYKIQTRAAMINNVAILTFILSSSVP